MPIMRGLLLAGLLLPLSCGVAHATEAGGGAYPNGAETLAVAALPPPGDYLINYATFLTSSRFNDGRGNSAIPGFHVSAYADIPRYIHITDLKILGGTWAQQIFMPFVSLNVHAAGRQQNRFGIGDIIVNPFILGWSFGKNHVVAAMDTFVPTGQYSKRNLANIGRNYFTFEPVLAYSYFSPERGPEASIKLMYDFNTKNQATKYRSGQEFHLDYAAGFNFDPVAVGLAGYYYKQTTDDRQFGAKVGPDGFRGEAFAIGPMLRYQLGPIPITAQYQHELYSRNRPVSDRFWLKAAFRF